MTPVTTIHSPFTVCTAETSAEWQPTPQIEHRLYYLSNFLRMATEGRVSPVRSQCQSDVLTMSSRTQRYYRKKAGQAIEAVLESIAPGNASWLNQQVTQRRTRLQAAKGIVEDTLVARLVILYEEAANWYTRQQILSLFVTDYSKRPSYWLYFRVSQNGESTRQESTLFKLSQDNPLTHQRSPDAVWMQSKWTTFLTSCRVHHFFKMWRTAPELLNLRVARA